jgi:high-affinity Fe2+/Pb2+ permease
VNLMLTNNDIGIAVLGLAATVLWVQATSVLFRERGTVIPWWLAGRRTPSVGGLRPHELAVLAVVAVLSEALVLVLLLWGELSPIGQLITAVQLGLAILWISYLARRPRTI